MISNIFGKCKLCREFDFRGVQISKFCGQYTISLAVNLHQVNEGNCFRYCPKCGRKLTADDFRNKISREEVQYG